MRMVLLPQAITAMLPPIVAQLVVALKDTALGYQITYVEAVRQGIQAGSAYSNYIPALLVVAAVMIAINFALVPTRRDRREQAAKGPETRREGGGPAGRGTRPLSPRSTAAPRSFGTDRRRTSSTASGDGCTPPYIPAREAWILGLVNKR